MISLNIGSPPDGNADLKIEWIVRSLFTIQNTLKASDVSVVTDAFRVDGTLTDVRILDLAAPPTLTDVTNVLGTLLNDFRERGPKGV